MKRKRGGYIQHDPTPAEIEERTAEIREGWTETEYAKRACCRHRSVEITEVHAVRHDSFGRNVIDQS